jgi:hypothetical protein
MPTLAERARARVARVLLGGEIDKIEEATRTLYHAYREGIYDYTPVQLSEQIGRLDSSILTDLLLQLGWEAYGIGFTTDTAAERGRAVSESRRLYKYSIVAQWQINLWTSFGLGETVRINPLSTEPLSSERDDEGNRLPLARVVFDEFWKADRNQPLLNDDKIHEKLSNWLLVEGERFLAYYASDIDGEVTVRRIPVDEIPSDGIITDPDDDATPLFYKRKFQDKNGNDIEWYYPDWRLFFSDDLDKIAERVLPDRAIRANRVNREVELGNDSPGSVVCIQHIALSSKDDSDLRGWPLLAPAGAPWIRAHKKFREDRAAVASAAAMFVQKVKHKGGSRVGNAFQAAMRSALSSTNYVETAPPPVAGSTWIGNEAVDLEKISNIGTAASDAKSDGEQMLLMAGLAGGVFPHYLGAGDAYRLATATSMERPLLAQWGRYQLFWSAQFRTMCRIVLQFHERYNNDIEFDTYDAEVSTDKLVEADLNQFTDAMSKYFRDVVNPQVEMGTMPDEVLRVITARMTRLLLQAFGIQGADEIASDEAFEQMEDEEPEVELPPQPPPVPPQFQQPPEGMEWAAQMAQEVRKRLLKGETTAEAVADWALATLLEAGDNGRE